MESGDKGDLRRPEAEAAALERPARLGEGSFSYAEPPFDPAFLVLDQSKVASQELVRLEHDALLRGLASFQQTLAELGVTGYRSSVQATG